MSVATSIEWTDTTWNPVRGCSRVSEGCRHCYAERQAARFCGEWRGDVDEKTIVLDTRDVPGKSQVAPYRGFATQTNAGPRWTGKVELIQSKLGEPLRWKKPRRVFVNSMSDLFHERLSDESIAAVFGVIASCPQHTFQVLTKRPERMRRWFEWVTECSRDLEAEIGERPPSGHGEATVCSVCYDSALGGKPNARVFVERLMRTRDCKWPLPNVQLGVSVENQETFDARVLDLVSTPAALRFISYEPALGPLDCSLPVAPMATPILRPRDPVGGPGCVHWLIVGGESGPGARPCDVAWIRSARDQCRAAGVPVFVKQLGARPKEDGCEAGHVWIGNNPASLQQIRHPKGGDMAEWPEDLCVRELPRGAA